MALKIDSDFLSTDETRRIADAAKKLLEDAIPLSNQNPAHAVVALVLAGASAAGYSGYELEQCIDLFRTYYANSQADLARLDAQDAAAQPAIGRGNN